MIKADVFGLNLDYCESERMWEQELLGYHLTEQNPLHEYMKFNLTLIRKVGTWIVSFTF